MRGLRIAVSLLGALAVHAALGRLFPSQGRFFDPFLLVVVFWALRCGEGWGMSVGLVAGWVQDSLFGGTVVGFAPLSKLLVGFVAGVAGTRLLIAGPGGRTLLLLAAAIGDVLLYQWLASLFTVGVSSLSGLEIVARTMVTAAAGAFVLEAAERRLPTEMPS